MKGYRRDVNGKEEDGEQTKYFFSCLGTTCHFFAGLLFVDHYIVS